MNTHRQTCPPVKVEGVAINGVPTTIVVWCVLEDHGIGAFEYWGAPGYDRRLCAVAERAALEDGTTIEIEDVPESAIVCAESRAFEESQDHADDRPPEE